MKTSLKKVVWIVLGGIVILAALSAWLQSNRGDYLQQEVA